MNTRLAEEILKTVAPYWYVQGTQLLPEYADTLFQQGLIEEAPAGGYKLTKKGHCFLPPVSTVSISFTKNPSDLLEAYFDL